MKKIITLILFILINLMISCSSTYPYKAKVVARGGLFMREDCSTSYKKVTLLPEFEIIQVTGVGPAESIDGIMDNWYYAEYDGKKGCLFGGYLNKVHTDIDIKAVKNLEDAIILMNSKKYSDASPLLDEAIKISPNYIEAYFKRGQANFKLKKYNQCIQDYTRVILAQRDSVAFNNRGLCRKLTGDKKGALEDYKDSLKTGNINVAITHMNLCALKFELNDSSAIKSCDKAVSLDPKYPHTYYFRSQIYKKEGKYSEAEEDEKKYNKYLKNFKE